MLNTFEYHKASARSLIDRDKVSLASQGAVASTCVKLFDKVQAQRPEVQLLSLACAFVLMLEASKYEAQDVLTSAYNLMADPKNSTGREARFDAMKHHMKEELINAR